MFTEIAIKTKREMNDSDHCRKVCSIYCSLGSQGFLLPLPPRLLLIYTSIFILFFFLCLFPFAFHPTKQIIVPPTLSPLCSALTHSSRGHTSVFLWYLLLQICVKLVNSFTFSRCFNVLCHCFIFFGALIPEHWFCPVSWLIWFRECRPNRKMGMIWPDKSCARTCRFGCLI